MLPVNPLQVERAGGLATRLPQAPNNAGRALNLTIDMESGGWSTRVGYEPFEIGATGWDPFANVGPVTSLHCSQAVGGGARQHLLFESDGVLSLLYQAGGVDVLRTLASDRHIPTPTEAGSWYTDTGHGTVITNGVDRPVLASPWPLGGLADSASTIGQTIRPFGFTGQPPAPKPHSVKPYPPPSGGTFPAPKIPGGGATTLWCPAQGNAIPAGGQWGLGFASNTGGNDGDKEAAFGYAVSFISSTGSESPLSAIGSVRWALKADAEGFRHAVAVDIPTGPVGTVARRIYRTANFSDDWVSAGDTSLYFLDTVRNNVDTVFFDAVPTSTATVPAPALLTTPLPAPQARFSALWGGCLWLDGGVNDPRTLYYSSPGAIEQFEASAYLDLSDSGGGVTAIFAHYAVLVVFREGGVDVVQGDAANGFTARTIAVGVTCRSPHSIRAVPGLGVVFLATDGVYALTGGLDGGSTVDIVELSGDIQSIVARMTPDCLPRAVGVYAPIAKEYQVYVPMDGTDRPSLGLVLHVERLANGDQSSPWSTREGFPVGALATLYDGTVVFGHHTGAEAGGDAERGLFVLSNRRTLGGVAQEQGPLLPGPPPTSAYRSAWSSFGDPQQQKTVTYVTLWVMTTGQPTVTVRHFKDFNLTPIVERSYRAQPPDAASLPVFDSAVLGAGSVWQEQRLVPIRVSVANVGCSWFAFELETTEDLTLVGYEVGFVMKGVSTVAGVRA